MVVLVVVRMLEKHRGALTTCGYAYELFYQW